MRLAAPQYLFGLLAIVLTFTACPSEPPPDPSGPVRTAVNKCGEALALGDYLAANNAAKAAIADTQLMALDSVYTDQIRFCYTTSSTFHLLNETTKQLESLLGPLLNMLNGEIALTPEQIVGTLSAIDGRSSLRPQGQSPLGLLLDSFVGPIRTQLETNAEQLSILVKNKRFRWKLTSLPVKIGDGQIADAGGKYDMGEIHLLYGITQGLLSTIYVAQSQEYALSISTLADYLFLDGNPVLAFGDRPGGAINNLLAVVMATSPKFLALDPTAGEELMREAGDGFAGAFEGILDGVHAMTNRGKNDTGYLFEHHVEDEEHFIVLNARFAETGNPIPGVDLQGVSGLAIPIRQDYLEAFERIRNDFAGVEGYNTNLQSDVFPLVSMMTVLILRSGMFDAIIELALENADEKTQSLAQEVITLVEENENVLLSALVSLIPVEVQIDFGHLFQNPVGLRDVFVAWVEPGLGVTDTNYAAALTSASLVYSYECGGDPLYEEIYLCVNPVDQSHFQVTGTAYYPLRSAMRGYTDATYTWEHQGDNFGLMWDDQVPLDPDGIATAIPVLGFKDPTFGGVLYLDVDAVDTDGMLRTEGGLQPANLQTLNAMLAESFSVIQTVMGN